MLFLLFLLFLLFFFVVNVDDVVVVVVVVVGWLLFCVSNVGVEANSSCVVLLLLLGLGELPVFLLFLCVLVWWGMRSRECDGRVVSLIFCSLCISAFGSSRIAFRSVCPCSAQLEQILIVERHSLVK